MRTETRKGKWLLGTVLIWLAFAPLAEAFYNPSTGRWLSRDPIEEKGGKNIHAFVANTPLTQIDRLGLDYYKTVASKFCLVFPHYAIIGDDGKGGSYEIDFAPVVDSWYQSSRRICGKGRISATHRSNLPVYDLEGHEVVQRVITTSEQDLSLFAAAMALDGKELTYCVGFFDCRNIDNCLLDKEGEMRVQKFIDEVLMKAFREK